MVQRSVLFTYLICCRMNRGVTAFGGLEIPKIVQTLIHVSRLLYIYISDLLEYLLCSDVRLNRLIYYDKRHLLFCLDFIFDFMLATNNKQLRNNISQQNILSTICTESLVNKT